MHRLAPALPLLAVLAVACSDGTERFACPGSAVASMDFSGTLTGAGCAAGAPAAGVNALYPATVAFAATVTSAASGAGAALCLSRDRAEPMLGTWTGDAIDVSLDTRGALLVACNARCAVTAHQRVTGTLQRDPGGRPIGFSGTLVDQESLDGSVTGADCTPCTTPCQASYALSGLPR